VSARTAVALLRRGLDWVAALLLLAILVITAARVAGRYLFGVGLPWSEELTRLLFVWLILATAARTRHMSIDLLADASGPRIRAILRIFTALVSVGVLGLLAYQALALVELTAFDTFTALGVSVQYLYWAVVVGCCLWIAQILARFAWPESEPDRSAE
jgi:TRAP-type transport system small permease protein